MRLKNKLARASTLVFFIVLFVLNCGSSSDSTVRLLSLPGRLQVLDMCVMDGEVYLAGIGEYAVYKIRNDSVIPFCGEYGVGRLKFRSPVCIQSISPNLYVGDGENLQIQVIDSAGRFVASYPKRSRDEFSFLDSTHEGEKLISFFIDPECMGIVNQYTRDGRNVQQVFIKQKGDIDFWQLGDNWGRISGIKYDSYDRSIIIAVNAESLHRYTLDSKSWQSIGVHHERHFGFKIMHDIALQGDHVYVLDQTLGTMQGNDGSARIYVFDRSLACVDTLPLPSNMYTPQAFDFIEGGRTIAVIDLFGGEWYEMKNPQFDLLSGSD